MVTSGMDGHFWFRSHGVRAAAVASGDRSQFPPSPSNRNGFRGSYFFPLLCPRLRIYLPIDPTVHVYIPTNNYPKIYGLYILFFVWTIGLSNYRTVGL
jgi:hypothetical protein